MMNILAVVELMMAAAEAITKYQTLIAKARAEDRDITDAELAELRGERKEAVAAFDRAKVNAKLY